MMQKEEFENYKHMIVSEQPIFHAYIDMFPPGIKHTIIFSGFRTQQRIKAEPFVRSMLHSLHSLRIMCPMIKTHTSI